MTDPAHWSSPEGPVSPVDEFFASAATDSTISDANAKVTAKGRGEVLACGFMCHGKDKSGRTCRKVIKGHNRGAVCPDCMDESVYHQCANGCFAYVHVGCADSAPPWTCFTCRAKPKEAAEAAQAADASSSESESAGEEPTIETLEFENYNECHVHLRQKHFVIKKKRFNKQSELRHVDYICEKSACNAKLTVKHRANSDAWLAPLFVEHQVGTILALRPTSSVCTITTDCLFRRVARTKRNLRKRHNSP
jgi:hypothetical protein